MGESKKVQDGTKDTAKTKVEWLHSPTGEVASPPLTFDCRRTIDASQTPSTRLPSSCLRALRPLRVLRALFIATPCALGIAVALLSVVTPAPAAESEPAEAEAETSSFTSGSAWDRLQAVLDRREAEPAASLEALRELVEARPGFHAAQYNLGSMLLDDDAAVAARHLRQASSSADPQLASRAWHNLALAYHQLGRIESAVAAAEAAVAEQPQDEGYRRNRDALRRILVLRRDAARRAAEEAAKRLRIAPFEPPPAWVGEAWEAQVTGAGGAGAPYGFSLGVDTELPQGLTLDDDGRLHGTPAAETAGQYEIDLVVSSGEENAEGGISFHILPEPAILTTGLPEAVLEETYRVPLRSQGFIAPRWQVEGLPPGLRLEVVNPQESVISGIPTEEGSFDVQLQVADDYHQRQASVSLEVSQDAFAPAEDHLPDATKGYPYEYRLTVRGSADHYAWEGDAANGLSVDAQGLVQGTPVQEGVHQIPVTIVAPTGEKRLFKMPIRVNPPPVIDAEQTISGQVATPLNQPIKVTGGTAPYRFHVEGSTEALPAGVQLSEDGVLYGVPQEAGSYPIRIRLRDRWEAGTIGTVQLEIRTHPEKQEQQEQQQQGGEEQQGEQEQQDGDEQEGGEQQQEGEDGQDGEQQQDGQQEQEDDQGDQQQGQPGDQDGEGEQDERRADDERVRQLMGADAAERFLEDLPQGDEERLLRRLLVPAEGEDQETYEGDPW